MDDSTSFVISNPYAFFGNIRKPKKPDRMDQVLYRVLIDVDPSLTWIFSFVYIGSITYAS